ncbi:MAG: hypothetical protein IMY75_08615 [Chloroflexi bacterium]|jgi:hypothetical protein|nr:hypothetical protein [Chloroflexota bacterium]
MAVLFIILSILVVLAIVGWPLIKRLLVENLMEPNAKPLTDEELRICESIVRDGKGYPYVCKWALKHKQCPCLPCEKLEKARSEAL